MARFSGSEAILEAAEKWRDTCLVGQSSVFSDKPLWTSESFDLLDRYYAQNLDYGEGSFLHKLKSQLAPAPPAAPQLAAELLWVLYLIAHVSHIGAETKLYQIKQVWEWSGEPLPDDSWALDEVLSAGVSNPGTAYSTHRWRELLFTVTMFRDWFRLDLTNRQQLLSEPWSFAAWVEDREHAKHRQFRHVLLFLLFPDHFERIATATHKRQIIRRFSEKWDHEPSIDYTDRQALDRELFLVRERLESEYSGQAVDFYQSPFSEIWRDQDDGDAGDDPGDSELPPKDESAAWLADRFGDVRIWALGAGEGARHWQRFLQDGVGAIGWDKMGDLMEYDSKEAILEALSELTGRANPSMDALALWQFSHEMRPGDVVLAKKGRSQILGWGVVTGDYEYDPSRPEYQNLRRVDWKHTQPIQVGKSRWVTTKTLTDFTRYPDWVRFAFSLIEGEGVPSADEEDVSTMVDDLFLEPTEFHRILDVLGRRKNVILQGPPGVGKTFIAKKIAWNLIGRKAEDQIEMVQFHQSFAISSVQALRDTMQPRVIA